MSAMGSLTTPVLDRPVAVGIAIFGLYLLPAALGHAGDAPLGGQVAEADAAHAELAHVTARPAADAAPVVEPGAVLRRCLPGFDRRFLRQTLVFSSFPTAGPACGTACPSG